MFIDYRALNKKNDKNQVPLPRIDEVWDQVGKAKYFSTLDPRSGYHQIRLKDSDIEKTAFRTRLFLDTFVLVYLDDILVYSKTKEEHVKHLKTVLILLREHKLYGTLSKYFATIATPLSNLIRKNNPLKWEKPQALAFQELKQRLTEAPVLRCADPNLPYQLTADASQTGVEAVLTQTDESACRPVAYASRKLNPAEQGYSTHERELLAIIYALHTRRPYLHGSKFKIMNDHHPLKYLDTQKTGKSNVVADALSRQYKENGFTYIKALLLANYDERYPQLREKCLQCQEAKSSTQNQLGNLRPFPPPTKKWEVISMDFIFDLPKTMDGKTAIMVVVDKLSKRTHFIPLRSDNSAKTIATTFCKEINKHHGLLRKIISDRDTRFGLGKYLPGVEFAYNNHVNDTTRQTPFFLEYGQHPFAISDIIHSDISENALKKHIGDKVMLSTKNLPINPGRTKKFAPKYIGPFTVLEVLASVHTN
ncbi:unnamed protein product [Chondrus crispus]|uniref:Integrase catalytic domain-containing protein n=1 Tax=Chondrus crispus TaxID=2769 RepID=R7QPB9_CHOCR|nr:unnamed protein product [Chondrus crispus]CDF39331.1 unnamed protein product [Chondrus crispus]|eukprot:XP_005719242.1 unnamed protein product [Chondrus crispus]